MSAAPPAALVPAGVPRLERTSTVPEAAPAPPVTPAAPEPPAQPDDPRHAWLTGIVVDASAAPVAGAEVAVLATLSGDNTIAFQMDRDFHARLERVARTESGADGRFRVRLPRGLPFDVVATAQGHADGLAPLCHAGEDVRIELDVERELHGMLTRSTDGVPIEDALVRVFHWPSYASRAARSASDGTYRVPHPFRESAYVEVLPHAEEALHWTWVELGDERRVRRDFALAPGVAVVGRVTARESGLPIEGATVGEGWQLRRTAVTDADGRYRLPGIGGGGAYGLVARANGRGQVKRLELPPVVDGAIRVDFELPRAWSATGRVVDRAGAPIAGARVDASGHGGADQGQELARSTARSAADGRFQLRDLAPGYRYTASVGAPGFASILRAFPEPSTDGGVAELGALVLGPPALVAGRARRADGTPLAGAEVSIAGEPGWRSAATDALGRFAFGDLPPGAYRVSATWYERPLTPELELVVAEGELREGLELVLPRGLALAGRVIDADGRGVGGVNVAAGLRPSDDPEVALDHLYAVTDADGAFRLEDAPAGTYWIGAYPRGGVKHDPDAPLLDGSVDGILAGGAPAEIVLPRGAVIIGRVLDPSGAPLVNHSVEGRTPGSDTRSTRVATDALGRFELVVLPDTTWTLVVTGPPQDERRRALLEHPGVAAGSVDVVLQLAPR
jgi:protocatechuate 3,4-dioxygenase beta subunit